MKVFLKALLVSGSGISMMRMLSLLCCLTAIVLAFIGISKPAPDYSGLSLLCGTFLGVAFAGKAIQKQIEVKRDKPEL